MPRLKYYRRNWRSCSFQWWRPKKPPKATARRMVKWVSSLSPIRWKPERVIALETEVARLRKIEAAADRLRMRLWTDRWCSPTRTPEYLALDKALNSAAEAGGE